MGGIVKSVGSVFGIGPDQEGKDSGNLVNNVQQLKGGQDAEKAQIAGQAAVNDPWFAPMLANYGQGKANMGNMFDYMASKQTFQNPGAMQAAMRDIATNPFSGSRMASEQVQSNPILGQLYGNGGTLSRTVDEEKNLAQRGYSLQPEDYEAYGQASGNIARQFGGAEQGLAQSLADRGLSNSGAATQQFMGSQGNKLEQLGQLQTNIAQNRMQMNMQRLGQTRGFLNSMAGNAEHAIQDQYGRQLSGAQFGQDVNMDAIKTNQEREGLGLKSSMARQDANNTNFTQRKDTKPKNIGDAFGSGLASGANAAGQALPALLF